MHPQILIRPAVPADYDAIARITRDAYLAAGYFESADHPYMQQIQDVAQRAANATIWVAEREGRIVGSVTLAVAGEPYADIARSDELEFRMLVVDPSVQRSGAGKAMVHAILDHARSLPGIDAVALTTGLSLGKRPRALPEDRLPAGAGARLGRAGHGHQTARVPPGAVAPGSSRLEHAAGTTRDRVGFRSIEAL